MRLRLLSPIVFSGLLWVGSAAHAADGHLSDLARFFDKTTPAPARQSIFDTWRKAALGGDTDAQYVVGTIYRRGDTIEPHVAERDADQARRYLSTAAAHGRLLAMAKMAELELAEDRPLEAAIWAQIYGAYRGWLSDDARRDGSRNERGPTLYFEDLLRRTSQRVAQKLGNGKTPEVLAGLNLFVAQHDKDVRAQLWREGIAPQWASGQVKFENAKSMRRVHVDLHNTVSEWVLVFAVDGSVARAEAIDAIPDFKTANGHHGIVSQYRAERADASAADRFALKTIDLHKAEWPLGPTITH